MENIGIERQQKQGIVSAVLYVVLRRAENNRAQLLDRSAKIEEADAGLQAGQIGLSSQIALVEVLDLPDLELVKGTALDFQHDLSATLAGINALAPIGEAWSIHGPVKQTHIGHGDERSLGVVANAGIPDTSA